MGSGLLLLVLSYVAMDGYDDFKPTGLSFAERVGEPEEFDAAVGKIALEFSFLEDTTRNLIVLLSGTDPKIGNALVAQLSFRQKLDVLSSVVRLQVSKRTQPEQLDILEGPRGFNDLLRMCQRAEELRNSYLHSSYSNVERIRISASARRGLRVHREPVDSSLLLDVADFIGYAGMELEQLPGLLNMADSISSSGNSTTYSKDGSPVAKFVLGDFQ